MVCPPRVAVVLATLLVTLPLAGCLEFFSPQEDNDGSDTPSTTPTTGPSTPATTPPTTPTTAPTTPTPTASNTPTPTNTPSPTPQGARHTIVIEAAATCSIDTYDPDPLTIKVGDRVRWRNDGGCAHTATSTSGPATFNTGNINQGASSDFVTFDAAGTYEYKCNYHAQMTASIVVQT